MTSEEKAIELISKFKIKTLENDFKYKEVTDFQAKHCALIAVDEISEHCYEVMKPFWEEVKTEIEKL